MVQSNTTKKERLQYDKMGTRMRYTNLKLTVKVCTLNESKKCRKQQMAKEYRETDDR